MNDENNPPSKGEFRFSQTQLRVLEALSRVPSSQHNLVSYYLGGIRVMEDLENPDRLSQAANSFRELLEKLYSVTPIARPKKLNPIALRAAMAEKLEKCRAIYGAEWSGEIHPELSDLLCELSRYLVEKPLQNRKENLRRFVEHHDPMSQMLSPRVAEARRRTLEQLSRFLEGVTHHNPKSGGLLELRQNVALIEKLILYHLSPSTAEHGQRLRELGSQPYTPDHMSEVMGLITSKGANHVFFFQHLQEESWLRPLADEGYFQDPPAPTPVERGERHLHWPESQCLLRLCEKSPEIVTEIVAALPLTENWRVNHDIAQISQKLANPSQAERLLPRLLEYAKSPVKLIGSEFGGILREWVRIGAVEQGLVLLRQIVHFSEDPEAKDKRLQEGIYYYLNQIKPCLPFEELDFSEILFVGGRALIQSAPAECAIILIEAAQLMVLLKSGGGLDADRDDGSMGWCRTLRGGTGHEDADRALIYTLLYSCNTVIARDRDRWLDIDNRLREANSLIFDRLRWHIYADHHEITLSLIREEALSGNLEFSWTPYTDEFERMIEIATRVYGERFLSTEEWQVIWKKLEASIEAEVVDSAMRPEVTSEWVEGRRLRLYYRQLRPFAAILTDEQKNLFTKAQEVWEDAISTEENVVGGLVIDKSPIDSIQLAQFENNQLSDYLNTWKPDASARSRFLSLEDIGVAGLATSFAELVRHDFSRFLSWPEWWKTIRRPIFMRRFLGIGVEWIKASAMDELRWDHFFSLCRWVVSQSLDNELEPENDEDGPSEESAENPHFHHARAAVGGFIGEALASAILPGSYRTVVFGLVTNLVVSRDRYIDGDAFHSITDPVQIAANSIRGDAIRLLIQYGYWVRKTVLANDELLDLWSLLESRLHPDLSEHSVIFAVVSRWLPQLARLDLKRTRKMQTLVFPDDETVWSVSWRAFVRHNAASAMLFDLFAAQYTRALQRVPEVTTEEFDGNSIDERLGCHLVHLFFVSAIPIESDLIRDFFKRTPVVVRAGVAGAVSRWFDREEVISEPTLSRIQAFVDWRFERLLVKAAGKESWEQNYDEISTYLRWFEFEQLPLEWRLTRLEVYLDYANAVRSSEFDIESFVKHMPTEAANVARIFYRLVEKLAEDDCGYWSVKHIKTILRSSIECSDEAARKYGEHARDLLLKRGYLDLIELDS